MPRLKPLTRALAQAQKEQEANEMRREAIAGGLAAYKNRCQYTNGELANELNIGRNTVIQLLRGEEVKLASHKHFRLLEVCRTEIQRLSNSAQKL